MKKIFAILIISALAFAGCTRTEKHVATGAAAGAVAGHLIGNNGTSTLIGAGVGAAAGAIIADQTK